MSYRRTQKPTFVCPNGCGNSYDPHDVPPRPVPESEGALDPQKAKDAAYVQEARRARAWLRRTLPNSPKEAPMVSVLAERARKEGETFSEYVLSSELDKLVIITLPDSAQCKCGHQKNKHIYDKYSYTYASCQAYPSDIKWRELFSSQKVRRRCECFSFKAEAGG